MITCECGQDMRDESKSTPNWSVYHCVCPSCGNRSQQASDQLREQIIAMASKPKRRVKEAASN